MWSKSTTTKGLRYLQIRENAVRECKNIIEILHIEGKKNPADVFSKEDKDPQHFTTIRDIIIQDPLPPIQPELTNNQRTNSNTAIEQLKTKDLPESDFPNPREVSQEIMCQNN